jgi:hypothetical protein
MPIRSHRDLVVWREAMQLTAECYRLALLLPSTERFGLRRRSVVRPFRFRRSRKGTAVADVQSTCTISLSQPGLCANSKRTWKSHRPLVCSPRNKAR